jgi:histone acetyltransferase (RNA polymerase elongator complex component)
MKGISVHRAGRRVIVPFFISHQGCPHSCVFCDQRRISGAGGTLPSPEEIREKIFAYRASSRQAAVEVAFYGGSFTMLPLHQQRGLLAPLQPLRDSGEVSAVRLSTRPDALDPAAIELLREFRVSLVEMGVQSMDDAVLAAAGRGHTTTDTVRAFGLLHDAGIAVGAQLLPGLPGDSPAGAIRSFHQVLELKPACLRVYPTVVVEGTELAARFRRGEYVPLPLKDAVALGARLLHAALRAGIPVIRMGLQATDSLAGPDGIVAGPSHPAFRHLAESELAYDLLLHLAAGATGPVTVITHPARVSAVTGQNNANRNRLGERGILLQKVLPDESLLPHELAVTIAGVTRKGNIVTDLKYPGPEAYHA